MSAEVIPFAPIPDQVPLPHDRVCGLCRTIKQLCDVVEIRNREIEMLMADALARLEQMEGGK